MSTKSRIVDFMEEKAYKPLTAEELLQKFSIGNKDKRNFWIC
jgi:hypothetical protein